MSIFLFHYLFNLTNYHILKRGYKNIFAATVSSYSFYVGLCLVVSIYDFLVLFELSMNFAMGWLWRSSGDLLCYCKWSDFWKKDFFLATHLFEQKIWTKKMRSLKVGETQLNFASRKPEIFCLIQQLKRNVWTWLYTLAILLKTLHFLPSSTTKLSDKYITMKFPIKILQLLGNINREF